MYIIENVEYELLRRQPEPWAAMHTQHPEMDDVRSFSCGLESTLDSATISFASMTSAVVSSTRRLLALLPHYNRILTLCCLWLKVRAYPRSH